MKINEVILTELRDPFLKDKYGAWVNAKTREIEYVGTQGHAEWAEYMFDDEDAEEYNSSTGDPFYWYIEAFKRNWVRVTLGNESISFEGVHADLKAIYPMIMATTSQPDMDNAYFDILKTVATHRFDSINDGFSLPEDRIKMMKFIKGEA